MSADREVTRIVRSWLQTDEHESAERVLDAVLDRIDTTPQRGPWWLAWRRNFVSNNLKAVLVGAAVLAIAVVGLGLYVNRPAGVGTVPTASPTIAPSPTQAPSPTSAPSPSAARSAAPSYSAFGSSGAVLEPGTYVSKEIFPVRVELVLDEEWRMWSGVGTDALAIYQGSPDPPAGRVIILSIAPSIYANVCTSDDGLVDPGPTTEDLAQALADQPGTEASELQDVTIDGYQGTYVEYTFTGDGAECDAIVRWPSEQGPRQALLNEHDQVWVVDVDGTRLVIDAASFDGTTDADLDEMRQIIESMQLGALP